MGIADTPGQGASAAPGVAFNFPNWNVKLDGETSTQSPGLVEESAAWLKDLEEFSDQEEKDAEESADTLAFAGCDAVVQQSVMDLNTIRRPFIPAEGSKSVGSRWTQTSVLSLPEEVLLKVLALLDQKDLVSISAACSHLHDAAMRSNLWRETIPGSAAAVALVQEPRQETKTAGPSSPEGKGAKPTDTAEKSPISGAAGSLRGQRYHGQHRVLGTKLRATVSAGPDWLSPLLATDAGDEEGWQRHSATVWGDWLQAKSMTMAGRVGARLFGLWQTHDQVRAALCSLWEAGGLEDTALVRRWLLKLTRFSWDVTYDALCAAFIHRADCVALQLRAGLGPAGGLGCTSDDSMATWAAVNAAWAVYRCWLLRTIGLCGRLAECVTAERAAEMMARGLFATPTLFDAGKAAFRSQVLLCYGIRKPLQAALYAYTLSRASGSRQHPSATSALSAPAMGTMIDVLRLLEEVDVADDSTRSRVFRTRDKMRRVFGLEPSMGSLRLTLGGPLRVPRLD